MPTDGLELPTLPPPRHSCEWATVYCGDTLRLLTALPDRSIDAVVTDPPYSSGGMTRSDRTSKSTGQKYTFTAVKTKRPDFPGDNRDQRSFGFWAALWFAELYRVTRPGGYLLTFTDWRQLPTMTDAIQAGGWVWRGIVPWDKTEGSKPQRGWFRAQCEYVLTASNGSMGPEKDRAVPVCAPGVIRKAVSIRDKHHVTGKPLEVMRKLLEVVPRGSTILDPFAGSGTTLVAAKELGIRSIGFEMSEDYIPTIRERLAQGVLIR